VLEGTQYDKKERFIVESTIVKVGRSFCLASSTIASVFDGSAPKTQIAAGRKGM